MKREAKNKMQDARQSFVSYFLHLASCFLLFISFPSSVICDENSRKPSVMPFMEGEELIYEIKWLGIPVGTGKLHIKERSVKDNREVFHIIYSAESNEFISHLYKVEDMAETFMDVEDSFPWSFKLKIREGKSNKDVETIFDQVNHKATFIKDQDAPMVFTIPSATQDAFSALYYLRTKNLRVGDKVVIDVFEDKKNWQVEVNVLKKEKIKIYSGEVDTILVKPLLKYEGIFQRKGDLYIWLTDDEKKIPIQVKTSIIIGSIQSKIISINGVGATSSTR